jgi:methionyl-tRNA formyltransferase
MRTAVVFAYHNVGVRCLKVLLSQGVHVSLVVTHEDDPNEKIWFSSVKEVCSEVGVPCITPTDPNVAEIEQQIKNLAPDFIFSFYYRHMLKAPILSSAVRGAYNMHGSLLPKYRGRVPVNWAIIHGETETGATLHVMNLLPDNGPIAAQQAVPILLDDTAADVFQKVTVAAEMCLSQVLPDLLAGRAQLTAQDLTLGAYFGRRTAEDGRIDWQQSALQIHNLTRAVTRPFPGAFAETEAGKLVLWRTRVLDQLDHVEQRGKLLYQDGAHKLYPLGGGCLQVIEAELNNAELDIGALPHSELRVAAAKE